MDVYEQALNLHKSLRGKIKVDLRGNVNSDNLKLFYSPGVGAASKYAQCSSAKLKEVSWTNNLVAVISDGSAVLGLGDIGPEGAMPVMEGKAMLFKHFANIDAVPIVLDVHSVDEIVAAVKAIHKSFGAINLEDIAAPKCFEIEDILKSELDIPIMHDDQHGTAVVVLAGIINSLILTGKNIADCKIAMSGTGAAGTATAKLLHLYGAKNIVMVDSHGIIGPARTDLSAEKMQLLAMNKDRLDGDIKAAISGADIFIGVSKAGLLTAEMVKTMAQKPVIFALANPEPEIYPDDAKNAGAYIVATGRSDFPNQVNNALGFPGIFRGALDHNVNKITDTHKLNAAEALAALVKNPTTDKIIPNPFDDGVVDAVASTIV